MNFISGITSNLFFIAVVCMMSWYQIIHSEEYKRYTITGHIQELEEDSGDGEFNYWFYYY